MNKNSDPKNKTKKKINGRDWEEDEVAFLFSKPDPRSKKRKPKTLIYVLELLHIY